MTLLGNLKLYLQEKKWQSLNKHNKTSTSNLFNINQVRVGKGTYGALYVLTHGMDATLTIGNYCSIGPQVAFVLQSDHPLNHFSTYPFKVMGGVAQYEAITKGDIVIEDDVWIGLRSIILSGVRIGKGSVIGAGSIITHDIPPYSIVVGVPGRVIGKRFDEDTIKVLEDIQIEKIRIGNDSEILEELYEEIHSADDALRLKKRLNFKMHKGENR